jgi:hypothetical protein
MGIALEIARTAGPGLIKWLSGSDKAAETAGQLIEVAQEVTGTASPDAALTRLKADPNLVLQLQARAVEIEGKLEEAYLADRQNARSMEVDLAKVGKQSDRKNWMILGDVVGLVVCIAALIYVPDLPGEARGILGTIAGFFGLSLRDAHQFEFGSSRGSQDKTELLARR